MSKWIKWVGLVIIVVLLIMQFFGIDKENPAVDPSVEFMSVVNPPQDIADMMKAACYDCHSHETKYPWYTNIAPLSWWIGHHIEEGRAELNFSEWGNYPADKAAHKAEESGEEVEEKHMPLKSYLITHSEAKLNDEQIERLSRWFMALADTRDVTERVRETEVQPAPSVEEGDEYNHNHDHDDHSGHNH